FLIQMCLTSTSTSFPYTTLFRSPFYKGYIRWDGNTKERKLKNAENGIIRKSNHPAIIPEDLWDKAHEKRLHDFAPKAAKISLRKDRKSTRLNSSHVSISYAVFCL